MITILLATQIGVTVFINPQEEQFAVLFSRFLSLNHQSFSQRFSLGMREFLIEDREENIRILLTRFEQQFGLEFTKTFPCCMQHIKWLTAEPPAKSGRDSWAVFTAGSPMLGAFKRLVAAGTVLPDAKLISCRYRLQPWLTDKGQVKETIIGAFTLADRKHVRDVSFDCEL